MLHIDMETRSPVPIGRDGAYIYATDPRTELLCISWAVCEGYVRRWTVESGKPFPQEIIDWIESGQMIAAHNAQFERLIFWYIICPEYGVPEPPIEQFYCTMAHARSRGLPGKLMLVSRLLGEAAKLDEGMDLIRACCIPPYDTDRLPELYAYCDQDVEAERSFARQLSPWTDSEQAVYVASEKINDRGVGVDLPFCREAATYKDEEVADIGHMLSELTDGAITKPTQRERILNWIIEREPRDCLKSGKTKSGWTIDSAALGQLIHVEQDVDPEVLTIAQLRLDGANTSVAKYAKMAVMAEQDEDHRIRGAFQFNTAITGRFSSRGCQLHNFTRNVPENADEMLGWVMDGYELDHPMADLASLLRRAIRAGEGNVLIGADWSGIEARLTAWYGDPLVDHGLLDPYREQDAGGADVYTTQAEAMAVEDRQIGKVATLACGFGGTGNAFLAMARAYGMELSHHEAQAYAMAWRDTNPWAPELWRGLERAAIAAVRSPGEVFSFSRVSYVVWSHWLCCRLPSGRVLYYYRPRLEYDEKWDSTTLQYRHARFISRSNVESPPPVRTWGGKLCENIVQAAAADLLRIALVACEDQDLGVIGHVHDEILCEVPKRKAGHCMVRLEGVMSIVPPWAEGLPLAVESWTGERYGKG